MKPGIPLSYARGKYIFDFRACWSTWVTRRTAESLLELNIVDGLIRCQITYLPSSDKDVPAGNQDHYFCEIPYEVGVREFDSLDLRKELLKAGLPQFCRQDDPPVTASLPDGPPAQAIAIWANALAFDDVTGKKFRGWATVANMVDVECAALQRDRSGTERLTVRLNKYAEKLVLERMGKDEVKADTCGGRYPLSELGTERDASGRMLFTYGLSPNRAVAQQQRACIAGQIKPQHTCAVPRSGR